MHITFTVRNTPDLLLNNIKGASHPFKSLLGMELDYSSLQMVLLELSWTGEGGDVKIAGSFNNWTAAETTQNPDNSRLFSAQVEPGK